MTNLIMFPGKNTPIKRYKSYFPSYNLKHIELSDKPNVILCHSLGIVDGLNYCVKHRLNPIIVSMDGVNLEERDLTNIAQKFKIYSFRPIQKQMASDRECYKEQIFYNLSENIRHYPYMNKKIRNQIVQLLN